MIIDSGFIIHIVIEKIKFSWKVPDSVYPLISPVVNGFEFLIFNLGRISISIKFEFYLKISTLAHSLTHIKKIPPNINCCVVLFDKNDNIRTYLQFIRITSLCSREPVRNEI